LENTYAMTQVVTMILHLWTFERDKTVASQIGVSLAGDGEIPVSKPIAFNSATEMIILWG